MRPMLIGAPAIEPVSLAEMKAWLREDASDEDLLIQALIVSARMTLEAYTRRSFVTQSWRIVMDAWPSDGGCVIVPFAPFQNISAIRVFDAADVAQTLAADTYRAPASSQEGRLIFKMAPPAPGRRGEGVEIDFVVGYGALSTHTPEPLRRAIMTLAAHWREKRGDDMDDTMPKAVAQLAAPFRRQRLT
jgi:uncharacterized phiE125 gp8 family phage protein